MSFRGVSTIEGYDVMVAGGGPAGFCAAVAAARAGAKTLLVEMSGCLGGMASAGLVPGWCGFGDGKKFIHRGIALELLAKLDRHEGKEPGDDVKRLGRIDAEAVKIAMDEIAAEAGVEVLFFTTLAGADAGKDGTVKAALVANKNGIFAVAAKLFVDATGDADLCAFAGAKTVKGDKDGDMQPVSLCMIMNGVDAKGAPEGFRKLMIDDPEFPRIKDDFFWPGFRINGGHLWGVDGSDVKSLSKAMAGGRVLAREFRDAFRKYLPEGRKAELVATASLLGVRETRRIVGEYELNVADYWARRRFKDEIAHNSFFIDIHPSWANRLRERKGEWDWEKEKRDSMYGEGEFQGIPYRCLLPQGLKNVVDAGRSISSDRESQSAIRVMPPCMSMGQAAGTAAGLLLKKGGADFRAVDVAELRAKLKADGAFIPDLPAGI